jgi:hypothetical protein
MFGCSAGLTGLAPLHHAMLDFVQDNTELQVKLQSA